MASKSLQTNWESELPSSGQAIQIQRGRKQNLYLQTISHLAQKKTSFGSFQPCLEDLMFLYGGDRKRTDLAIKVLKRKGLLSKISVSPTIANQSQPSKYLPRVLALSQKGAQHLRELRKNGTRCVEYQEWLQVRPRITTLLNEPQLHFFDLQPSFFHVRELLRLIYPLIPANPPIDNTFISKIVAFNKGKHVSMPTLCQQVLGFVDVLLRLQGEYLPAKALWEITKVLENHGVRVDLTKRKLYPHIQNGARLFGSSYRTSGRIEQFYNAVTKAIDYYCETFEIEDSVKEQILAVNTSLRQSGRISLDPEARALGIIGYVIDGFFLNPNRKRFPLPPGMLLAGRDQMHQIRKLFRKLDLKAEKSNGF